MHLDGVDSAMGVAVDACNNARTLDILVTSSSSITVNHTKEHGTIWGDERNVIVQFGYSNE
jgi:hypothetical protein